MIDLPIPWLCSSEEPLHATIGFLFQLSAKVKNEIALIIYVNVQDCMSLRDKGLAGLGVFSVKIKL